MSHDALGGVPQRVGVGGVDALALKAEEGAGNLQKPAVLCRVVEAIHVGEDGADALARLNIGGERRLVHAGGVGQFGVVVIAQNVVERARRRTVRVDVRVRIEKGYPADFGE